MSVIAKFVIPAEEFELGQILEIDPRVRVRLERTVPTGESVMPYFWVSREFEEGVKEALEDDGTVESVSVIDSTPDESLFRVEWTEDIDGFIESVIENDVSVLEGKGTGDDWEFQVRLSDYDQLSDFYQSCVEDGMNVELSSVHGPLDTANTGEWGLTDEQRRTLETALENGYFDVPRGITLVELGHRLGISDSAVSQRLRRGLASLIDSALSRQYRERSTEAMAVDSDDR